MKNTTQEINSKEFKAWIIENLNLSSIVAKDIASRAKRVGKEVSLLSKRSESEIVDLYIDKSRKKLSDVVYSQLKRAVRLYREFIESTK